MADGSVNPSQATTPPSRPARMIPSAIPTWLLAGPGQELTERHEVGVVRLVEPAAPDDVLLAEVAEVRDRSAERGQAEPSRDPEHLEQRCPSPRTSVRACRSAPRG